MTIQKDQELSELAGKIVKLLNEGAQQMDTPTSSKLLAARKHALAHFSESAAPSPLAEWAMAAVGRVTAPFGSGLRAGMVAAALVATLAGAFAWKQATNPQGSETTELDVGLLTDELPITAYLDQGFDAWVKPQSR